MSSKNDATTQGAQSDAQSGAQSYAPRNKLHRVRRFWRIWMEPARPLSLRLRLTVWYGTLLAVALAIFATLILLLATDAINASVDNAIRTEAGIASLAVQRELAPEAPYWPAQLSLDAVNTYRDPGGAVTVLDAQHQVRYQSPAGARALPLDSAAVQAAFGGQTQWYTARVDGERARVEARPIRAPGGNGPIIGALLVAKSLSDVDSALTLLRTLLLVIGLIVLGAALLGGWTIAAYVLHPIAAIGGTARAIVAATARGTRIGSLSHRVSRPRGQDELAQLVDTFNEMLAALESATQTQRRFIADASHELRAPLTTVQGNLAFLQRHADEIPPDERRTMLADAHAETLSLARLVDELLLLARADASVDGATASASPGAPETIPQLVELDRALLQLVRGLRGRLAAEGNTLKIEIGCIEPVRVRGDEESLRRVALILLDNAIKYTPASPDAAAGRVTVSLQRVNGEAVLRVRDTGIGIAPTDLPHIFERFYRSDPARGRQGSGLGLSIAQTLVERAGGHITVESAPGAGSTFSVWLPAS